MKKVFMVKTVVVLLLIFSWFHYFTLKTAPKIKIGATINMVEKALGTPAGVEQQDKITKWVYTSNEMKKIFFFEEGKVVIEYTREL